MTFGRILHLLEHYHSAQELSKSVNLFSFDKINYNAAVLHKKKHPQNEFRNLLFKKKLISELLSKSDFA